MRIYLLVLATALYLPTAQAERCAQPVAINVDQYVVLVEGKDCISRRDGSSASGYQGTGFRVHGENGIWTALHIVNGCREIYVDNKLLGRNPFPATKIHPAIVEVAIRHDVARLREASARQELQGLVPATDTAWLRDDSMYVVGFPQRAAIFTRRVPVVRQNSSSTVKLQEFGLLDAAVRSRNSPSPDVEVLALGFGIAQGDSGAPVLDCEGSLVGVADGSRREDGTQAPLGLSWATLFGTAKREMIPSSQVQHELLRLASLPTEELIQTAATIRVKGVDFVLVRGPEDETGFYMSASEINNAELLRCQSERGRGAESCSTTHRIRADELELPARAETAEAAESVCRWLGARIPRESEWEKAAELGIAMEPASLSSTSNTDFRECSANLIGFPSCDLGRKVLPVRKLPPNRLGLYDLFGNMWEWCRDASGHPVLKGGAYDRHLSNVSRLARAKKARPHTKGVRCVIAPIEH